MAMTGTLAAGSKRRPGGDPFTPRPGRDKMPPTIERSDTPMDDLKAPGTLSEVAPLRSVLLKHPREAWIDQAHVRGQWQSLGYTAEPDLDKACREYDVLVAILARQGAEISFLPAGERTGLDAEQADAVHRERRG